MYITRLILENFQSHVETALVLSSGYNVLFGESEVGKTAVWRALRWVIYDGLEHVQPFVRTGAKHCRVSVSFSNGLTIAREGTARGTRYTLSQRGTVLSQTTRYPLAFLRKEGLRAVRLADGLEVVLNLASQAEGLLSLPAPVFADLFKRVTGRHIIEAALSAAEEELDQLPTFPPDGVPEAAALTPRLRLEQVVTFLREVARFAADYDRRRVEKIVTYFLQYVFGATYQFKIRSAPATQGIGFIVTSGGRGSAVVKIPLAGGGGLTDLVALALRFALLEISYPPIRGPFVLDEPARNVSDAYTPRVARLLKTLADVFQRQVIITTNNQHLIGTADTLYIVRLENGISKVHRR